MESLREWQLLCILKAIDCYKENPHFFCHATPGSGKTIMAVTLAYELKSLGLIDFVFCFSPSITVSSGMRNALEDKFKKRFDGRVGSCGGVYTYQYMKSLDDGFWGAFSGSRLFLIFDEVHHCAYFDEESANSWGRKIEKIARNKNNLTLSMSGTPWRSDQRPIVLAEYIKEEGVISSDFSYTLSNAIDDGVCRSPVIQLIDNEKVKVRCSDGGYACYPGIQQAIESSGVGYERVLENDDILEHILKQGIKRLSEIRLSTPDAAGLVVASSIAHAYQIQDKILREGETAVIVTSDDKNAHEVIDDFKGGDIRWIVSVGMVSEGTDIPRLQVCCHLSRIRTELHFRQVLGRVLRKRKNDDGEGWLFVPAEPDLVRFSKEIGKDAPGSIVMFGEKIERCNESRSGGNFRSDRGRESESLGLRKNVSFEGGYKDQFVEYDSCDDVWQKYLLDCSFSMDLP